MATIKVFFRLLYGFIANVKTEFIKREKSYGSYSIGVTPNHFEKAYHDENLVGDFWYNLAKSLDESLHQSLTDKIGRLSK